jgi:glucose dehydrogenase
VRAAVAGAAAALAAVVAIAGCGGDDGSSPPARPADVGWPLFGDSAEQARSSPLSTVDRDSVARLGVAWSYSPGPEMAQWESYPVVVGRTMYLTTNTGQVLALDAASGAERWSYTPKVDFLTAAGAGEPQPVNRGVTVARGRVYLLTYDERLVALRASDGSELWSRAVADPRSGAIGTSPPTYWDGRLIVGSAGSDAIHTRGFVAAYDATTGRRLWRFWTVAPGRGGGRVWMPPTVDPRSGIVYAGTGNPSPVLTGNRGCEDWVSGMVALDARDGTLRWGAHEVCGDVWDYDGGQPPLVYDAKIDDRTVRAVGHANKSGTYWIRDAATGRELAPPRALIAQTTPRPRPSRRGARVCPGALGGIPYGPAALDPGGASIYQPTVSLCMTYRLGPDDGRGVRVQFSDGAARVAPGTVARGAMLALDSATGRVRWRRAMPAPMVGGALATAGGLVFSGCDDGYLYAFDARDGATVWRGRIGLPFGTAPLTYRVGGVQYVAIVAGGSSITSLTGERPGARLVVLRLGGRPLPAR